MGVFTCFLVNVLDHSCDKHVRPVHILWNMVAAFTSNYKNTPVKDLVRQHGHLELVQYRWNKLQSHFQNSFGLSNELFYMKGDGALISHIPFETICWIYHRDRRGTELIPCNHLLQFSCALQLLQHFDDEVDVDCSVDGLTWVLAMKYETDEVMRWLVEEQGVQISKAACEATFDKFRYVDNIRSLSSPVLRYLVFELRFFSTKKEVWEVLIRHQDWGIVLFWLHRGYRPDMSPSYLRLECTPDANIPEMPEEEYENFVKVIELAKTNTTVRGKLQFHQNKHMLAVRAKYDPTFNETQKCKGYEFIGYSTSYTTATLLAYAIDIGHFGIFNRHGHDDVDPRTADENVRMILCHPERQKDRQFLDAALWFWKKVHKSKTVTLPAIEKPWLTRDGGDHPRDHYLLHTFAEVTMHKGFIMDLHKTALEYGDWSMELLEHAWRKYKVLPQFKFLVARDSVPLLNWFIRAEQSATPPRCTSMPVISPCSVEFTRATFEQCRREDGQVMRGHIVLTEDEYGPLNNIFNPAAMTFPSDHMHWKSVEHAFIQLPHIAFQHHDQFLGLLLADEMFCRTLVKYNKVDWQRLPEPIISHILTYGAYLPKTASHMKFLLQELDKANVIWTMMWVCEVLDAYMSRGSMDLIRCILQHYPKTKERFVKRLWNQTTTDNVISVAIDEGIITRQHVLDMIHVMDVRHSPILFMF